jgi:hypothetical protein
MIEPARFSVSSDDYVCRMLDAALDRRLDALIEEGFEIFDRFDREVRDRTWHPFVATDYRRALSTLVTISAPNETFLEWGSATGVIAIMADLLGFAAYGIELDAGLVDIARRLAERHHSRARFAVGSFVPDGYRWKSNNAEGRHGTIGDGTSAYAELGRGLDDFSVVYAYPWGGEEPMMLDLMRTYGDRDACLLLSGEDGVRCYSPRR